MTLNQEFAFGLYAPGYNFYFSHGTSGSASVCIAVRQNTGVNIVKLGEIAGRLLSLRVTARSETYDLTCIYAPIFLQRGITSLKR